MNRTTKIWVIAVCVAITALLHMIHSEWMGIIVDSTAAVGVVLLLLDDCK
jgi:hypothetical protein